MCLILFWGIAGWLHAQTVPTPTPVVGNFKTLDGKEYKNATVSRVEPDGILLRTKSGISKVYFVELPKKRCKNGFITMPQKLRHHNLIECS